MLSIFKVSIAAYFINSITINAFHFDCQEKSAYSTLVVLICLTYETLVVSLIVNRREQFYMGEYLNISVLSE